jgi:hypothetical protein
MSATEVVEKGAQTMAVVSVSTLTVKPDRYEDFLADARKIKAIVEKCGAKNVRLIAGLVAGQATGSLAFIAEADDWTAYGAAMDKLYSDPEAQPILASGNSSAGPATAGQTTVWVDVPL